MSLILLTVSKVQTEKDHLSPMEEWNVTIYYKRKQKSYMGPRTTLYMYELSFCIDKPCMNLWYFPT